MKYYQKIALDSIFLLTLLFTNTGYAQQIYFPERGLWQEKPAYQLGFSESKIKTAIDFAQQNEYSGERDLRVAILKGYAQEPFHEITGPTKKRGAPAGVIIKNGYIIAKWGDVERVDMTFSVTKSFLSTIAGLAQDEGLLDVEDKVKDYIWDGTFAGAHNSKIKWSHLLYQSSDWQGTLFGMEDWADRPPKQGDLDDWKYRTLNEPGTIYEYNDVRVNLLAYSLLHVWRKPLPVVLKEKIMDKIGASSTWRWFGADNAYVNVDGQQVQSVTGGGHSGGGIFINTLDMARFGLLFQQNGKWKAQQLLSEEWIQRIRQPSKANLSYGYLWWLNNKAGNQYMEGVPDNLYYAAGFGGNFIAIDPTNDLVIVTRWLEPNKLADFLRLVVAAKDEKATKESVSLFNGKDLRGWKIHGTEKWYVKDGLLVCESGADKGYGYLATEKSFKNFDLTLEFKQEANGNSGVFFRSSLEGTKITGWQAEVAPPRNNTGGIYESYGRGWLIQPKPSLDKALKMGEWNTMRVRVIDDEVTTWLNGVEMIHLKDEKIGQATGQIALQIHDGGGIKVNWRNIKIITLD